MHCGPAIFNWALTTHKSHFIDATAYSLARFGQGSGPIYLDQVGCTGREQSLEDCTSNPIGIHDCSHFEDAGVGCQGT